jgi:large subunit ribosomal protein L19
MQTRILNQVEQPHLKKDIPQFEVGDTVDVAVRIVEGDKERIQVFSGTVIMRKGAGINSTFTVRRIVNNEGVERIFPLHSPFISTITVKRSGERRRAKLFYLRERVGKAVRLTEKRKAKKDEGGTTGIPSDESTAGDGQPKAQQTAPAKSKKELAAAAAS